MGCLQLSAGVLHGSLHCRFSAGCLLFTQARNARREFLVRLQARSVQFLSDLSESCCKRCVPLARCSKRRFLGCNSGVRASAHICPRGIHRLFQSSCSISLNRSQSRRVVFLLLGQAGFQTRVGRLHCLQLCLQPGALRFRLRQQGFRLGRLATRF